MLPDAHQWHEILVQQLTWGEKMIRPFLVYLFLLIAFRIAGKRQIGQMGLFDFVIALLISNVVQNAMIGDDNSILGALAGAVVIMALSAGMDRLTAQSPGAQDKIEEKPTLLMHKGKILEDRLKAESLSNEELLAGLRREGVACLEEVRYAILEANGSISVIKEDASAEEGKESVISEDLRRQISAV